MNYFSLFAENKNSETRNFSRVRFIGIMSNVKSAKLKSVVLQQGTKEENKKENTGPFSKPWRDSDAILVVEEKELHVHTNILSIASPVFDNMFNGKFKEAQTKRVPLPGKSFHIIEQMLKIIYPKMDFECGKPISLLFWS